MVAPFSCFVRSVSSTIQLSGGGGVAEQQSRHTHTQHGLVWRLRALEDFKSKARLGTAATLLMQKQVGVYVGYL